MRASPEFQLALACCRWCGSGEGAERIAELAAIADGAAFHRLAARHRIEAMAWHALACLDLAHLLSSADQLRADASRIARSNLLAGAEYARLQSLFEKAGVPLLFIKGLALGQLAYGTPAIKMGVDIDLLVEPDRLGEAAELLAEAGYRCIVPESGSIKHWHGRHKESQWGHAGGFMVDLHSALADHPWQIPAIGMDSPVQKVGIGNGIAVRTLADEELFAYLAVHGASSAWFRLKWISDFAAFVDRRVSDRTEEYWRRSQVLGAGRAAGLALLLADRCFGIPISASLKQRLNEDPATRILLSVAWSQLAGRRAIREPTERLLGTLPIHLSQMLLMDRPGFATRSLIQQVRAVTSRG